MPRASNRWFRIHPGYALAAVALFAVEAAIALWLHDPIVRPYAGDSLAVVLVYLALRAVMPIGIHRAVLIATVLAFAIEITQYFHLVRHLGLGGSPIARAVLGSGFDPKDFGAYLIGTAAILLVEKRARRRSGRLYATPPESGYRNWVRPISVHSLRDR